MKSLGNKSRLKELLFKKLVQGGVIMNKEFYVGWGTLALINAGLAQGKNRSGLNWFLLTLFLGPVATFCLVISDKK